VVGVSDAPRWTDVGSFIREQRSTAELSLRRLSELAGVSNPYLSQIERGLRKPSAEILNQIAKALQISSETLYVRAGILDERETGATGVIEAVMGDPIMSDEQKRSLLRIYESFVAEAERGE
jgi:transcriptional regulator with XRE-family HTH domain